MGLVAQFWFFNRFEEIFESQKSPPASTPPPNSSHQAWAPIPWWPCRAPLRISRMTIKMPNEKRLKYIVKGLLIANLREKVQLISSAKRYMIWSKSEMMRRAQQPAPIFSTNTTVRLWWALPNLNPLQKQMNLGPGRSSQRWIKLRQPCCHG